jgi:hypothetical protein
LCRSASGAGPDQPAADEADETLVGEPWWIDSSSFDGVPMNRLPLLALLALLAVPDMAAAEVDSPAPPAQSSQPDFLFQMPKGSFSFRWTTNVLKADSDWFGFVRDQLTLDHGDFVSMGIAGDVSFGVTPRFDVVIGGEYTGRNVRSEYRDFVDNNRCRSNRTHGCSRCRSPRASGTRSFHGAGPSVPWPMSRRDWSRMSAAGLVCCITTCCSTATSSTSSISQSFSDQLPSEGWTPTAYINGGLDWLLVKKLAVTVDVRYQLAAPELDESAWTGFEPLELSGIRISTGIRILF